MINLAYRAARWKGAMMRRWYRARLPQIVRSPGRWRDRVPASVYALSCSRDLPEQVASLRSLLLFVGVPDRYVIVSDGSYSPAQIDLLTAVHPCVQVIPLAEFATPTLPPQVADYAHLNPMGKKLMMILSIPIQGPTIYSDSDIFFFPGADSLRDRLASPGDHSFYLPDADPAFDRRILSGIPEREPINGGFIVFRRVPDWGEAMARFLALDGPPNYFTEQTMMHLTLHRDEAQPLERDRYIMGREDEFHWRDRYAGDRTILRHYVTPVRHKFWGNWQYLK